MSDEDRIRERVLPTGKFSWREKLKEAKPPEKDKFEGFREPEYSEQRWEPDVT